MSNFTEYLKDTGWLEYFKEFFDSKKSSDLMRFMGEIRAMRDGNIDIYPPEGSVFRAFKLVPCDKVKVVIVGQDPYYGPGQANGLSFAVNTGQMRPPSLRNIFKELQRSVGVVPEASSNLEGWASQGVLLLNSILTVERGLPGSHSNKGWEEFTDFLLKKLVKNHKGIVFMLWGNYAQTKTRKLKSYHHLTLTAPHPSPLSAHKGFFGCDHFNQANNFLELVGKDSIDWLKIDNESYCSFIGHFLSNQRKDDVD